MKIWIIITTSLIESRYKERKYEYMHGISLISKLFSDPKYNIVIVENNSKLSNKGYFFCRTFLDNFGIPVLYTKNNEILNKTGNYGIPELMDVFACINHFKIQDDDFIVKITGRYFIHEDSPMFNAIDNLENKPYSAIVRFNQFDKPASLEKTKDCISGFIGLKCRYVKQIQFPPFDDIMISIEMKWAEVISNLNDDEIRILDRLGISIKPLRWFDHHYMDV
jgi:hypothetical protein